MTESQTHDCPDEIRENDHRSDPIDAMKGAALFLLVAAGLALVDGANIPQPTKAITSWSMSSGQPLPRHP